jgi:AraC-like DNA-binding protein
MIDVFAEIPPPLRHFRLRSMAEARSQLLGTEQHGESVPEIARDLGYNHFSHSASYYKGVYGESPSTPIDSTLGAAGPSI